MVFRFFLLLFFFNFTYASDYDNCFISIKNIKKNDNFIINNNIKLKRDKRCSFFKNRISSNDIEKYISSVFIKNNKVIKHNMVKKNKKLIINFNNKIIVEYNNAILLEKQFNSFKFKHNKKINKIVIDGDIN